jgi:nitrogen regulatory protein PII-like uncharacterized protein
MKYFKGQIIYFRYERYHVDPNPLGLILYADNRIVHCLNLNYLSRQQKGRLIHVIAQIAGKKIENPSAYELYHKHLKREIPSILKASYRTYKPQYIHTLSVISDGFNKTIGWLTDQKETAIRKFAIAIQKRIKKVERKTPEQVQKDTRTSEQIIRGVEQYVGMIKNIHKERVDRERYTRLKQWKQEK